MRLISTALLLMFSVGCSADSPNSVSTTTAPRSNRALMANGTNPTHLFSGIGLSSTERQKMFAINTRYNEQVDLLRKNSANPNGPIDAATLANLRTLRSAQFAEWRSAMTPEHAIMFDRNLEMINQQEAQLRAAFPGTPR